MSDVNLSPQGRARRVAMLDELTTVMVRTHRRRSVRRRFTAACGWALLATAAVLAARTQTPPPTTTDQELAVVTPDFEIEIEIVENDARVLDRWRPAATFTATIIDDDTLLATLDELDRPTGMIKSNGRTWLTAAVTD